MLDFPEITKNDILFEDEHYIAIAKPAGILVHPSPECTDRVTLLSKVKKLTGHYLYPLHRLDRPVSGIVLFALSSEAAGKIKEYWNSDSLTKKYLCLCHGVIEEAGEFNFQLSNDNKVKQDALTLYSPIQQFEGLTYLEVEIKTGRKHQIRRHFSRRMRALIGDSKYGKKKYNQPFRDKFGLDRLFLHAHSLTFFHPYTKKDIHIECPLPSDLQNILNNIS